MFTRSNGEASEVVSESSKRTWRAIVVLFATIAAIVSGLGLTLPAYASGDYGPDTCLQGWVWRGVVPNDHVCVTGDTRTQVGIDNSQAAARRNPNGGPYGPDTCLQGWVWRDAVTNDHVCVTVATRSQAANDNAQAAARRDSLNVWATTYTIPPVCHDGTCTSTSTDDIARYRLYGNHINTGRVIIRLFRVSNNATLGSWSVNATPAAVGGQFSLDTGKFVCAGNGANDSYFRVYDTTSARWSNPYYVKTICYVL
ncbi:MAG: hypothetical protein H0U76_10785 [Ktedonobacteraceae bacterium]|nr:hypothetical protein [Ktedonobacteraceae bacterium]